jgi:hypothetical protein
LAKEVPDPLLHIHAILVAAWHVTFVGEEHELVGNAGMDEGVQKSGCVAEMDVFVDQAMHQQEAALDLTDVC